MGQDSCSHTRTRKMSVLFELGEGFIRIMQSAYSHSRRVDGQENHTNPQRKGGTSFERPHAARRKVFCRPWWSHFADFKGFSRSWAAVIVLAYSRLSSKKGWRRVRDALSHLGNPRPLETRTSASRQQSREALTDVSTVNTSHHRRPEVNGGESRAPMLCFRFTSCLLKKSWGRRVREGVEAHRHSSASSLCGNNPVQPRRL